MYVHMDYLQSCFNRATDWNEDNIFPNVTATSRALLDFPVPNGVRLDISSQATAYLALSMTLLNHQSVNGSLAYLYLRVPLENVPGTASIPLQSAIAGFRPIEPYLSGTGTTSPDKALLWYGRMYFPGSALEAMIIKRIAKNTRLLVKCVSNPHLERNGTVIAYLQTNCRKFSREIVYSTNDALVGFRCLYNFGKPAKSTPAQPLRFDNSVVSAGAELWYAARTMSPGLSTVVRYSTRSTATGKPLTMTLSCNPILGHISLTYNVKTSVSLTVCSKYDFNWYSYASNLLVGFELYNFSPKRRKRETKPENVQLDPEPLHLITNYRKLNQSIAKRDTRIRKFKDSVVTFQNLVDESNFTSVIKASGSLSDRLVKIMWVGRCKDFLVTAGAKFGVNPATSLLEIGKIGVGFSYTC